ncbi:Crp/Fnr family transcriptional regulator, partial [Ulvibacterium sp.]|uniref:Crp/Fnr family transcriptional regulator n=1 Tax=Ulvibacterium sp. TaxID=2665914 RepID=UPI00263220CD
MYFLLYNLVRTDKYIKLQDILQWADTLDLNIESIRVKKGNVFLEQGHKCSYFYYIVSGLMRIFYYDREGHQVTHWFSSQDMMITSPDSFFNNNENILNFEALEDCELLLVTRDHLKTASRNVPGFDTLYRKLIVDFTILLSRRVMSIHTESAEYRYLQLIKQYPGIFHRTKLSYIASYLGVTQQSLSRIRK